MSKNDLEDPNLALFHTFSYECVQISGVVVTQLQPASARMQPSDNLAWRRRPLENTISEKGLAKHEKGNLASCKPIKRV
jgi:hypothetical protein